MKGHPLNLCNNLDGIPGIHLVEQAEQKFRRIRVCFKEKKGVTTIVGLFYIKASTKNSSKALFRRP